MLDVLVVVADSRRNSLLLLSSTVLLSLTWIKMSTRGRGGGGEGSRKVVALKSSRFIVTAIVKPTARDA